MSTLPRLPGPRERGLGLSLPEWQRTVARVAFHPSPPIEDLEALGAPKRWRIYRHLVRSRLRDMLEAGLPRTRDAVGTATFSTWFSRWLAASPPRTRFLRDVVTEATNHWLPRWEAAEAPAVPPWAVDLCRFEAAVWRCRWAEDPREPPPPFDFQAPAHLHPGCELLMLRFPVYQRPTPPSGYEARSSEVLLVRHPESLRVRYHILKPLQAAIVRAWERAPHRSAVQNAREAAECMGVALDAAFAEALGALVSRLVEAGALPPPKAA